MFDPRGLERHVARVRPDASADDVTDAVANAAGPESSADRRTGATDAAELIPGWLALLVLILLLAVAGLGGYLIRGALTGKPVTTPTQLAVDEMEQQLESDPNDPERLLALGYAYQQEGRYDEALGLYEQTLALDPGNTGALFNKGVALTLLGKSKEAEVAYWDVLEVAPDHALAAKALGDYYVGKKQYKSALTALEPVIAVQPQYADLQYLAGYSCEQLGITETAITYYRGALSYDPDDQGAKDGLDRLGATEQAQ